MKFNGNLLYALIIFFAVVGCGKKGDPTLKSYERPDTPSSLSAVHRDDSIILKWSYSKAKENLIQDFVVLRSSGSGFEVLAHVESFKRYFVDRDIKNGRTYGYKVISRSRTGVNSIDSEVLSALPSEVPPRPVRPGFLVSGDTVTIRWESTDAGSFFNIYKSTQKGVYGDSPVNLQPVSGYSFRDNLSLNSTVYYTIRSLKGGPLRDESPASDEITVDPSQFVPPKPDGLDAYAAPDRVILSWKEIDEPWVTGYKVYRKLANGDYVLIGVTQVPTFTDNDAPVYKRDYRVAAVGPVKEGAFSEVRGIVHIPQR